MACPCGIGAVPTASLQLTRRPRRYPRGSSIGTGGMLGDFSTHSSVGPPQPVPPDGGAVQQAADEFPPRLDRKSTRLNSSHLVISYAVFCLKKKKNMEDARVTLCAI